MCPSAVSSTFTSVIPCCRGREEGSDQKKPSNALQEEIKMLNRLKVSGRKLMSAHTFCSVVRKASRGTAPLSRGLGANTTGGSSITRFLFLVGGAGGGLGTDW